MRQPAPGAGLDVAIVGGGPAGALLATLLARSGRRVVVLERSTSYRWRACGVFSSPASVDVLRAVGVGDEALDAVARPIPAMRVEARGEHFRLTYGDDGSLRAPAVGFDRSRLDPLLLQVAADAGAEVVRGITVESAGPGEVVARDRSGKRSLTARVVVGADGIRSVVARSLGVARPARLGPRTGLTFHVADPQTTTPRDARMVVLDDGYVGLAPVPGGRVNVGIVLGRSWADRLRSAGAERTTAAILRSIPGAGDDPVDWPNAQRCDSIEGAAPIGHRAVRRAGPGWLLVGDAAGFLDPFTGEGLHRTFVSARLAAATIDHALSSGSSVASRALAEYDTAMTRRFRSKDAVSLLVQAFLANPRLFGHAARRLAARDEVRETMGLVMGDLVPASRALDPRFVATLLRP